MSPKRPKHRAFQYPAFFNPNQLGFEGPNQTGRGLGFAQVWHRQNVPDVTPYCVPNEAVCGEVGRFLRLPIPPFAITYWGSETLFSSLDFNYTRDSLPPVEPSICWDHLPELCTGVLLFDVLIANPDRHEENLAVDNVAAPTLMMVFDHDQALLGGIGGGTTRLDSLWDRLGITGSPSAPGNRHCLLDVVDTKDHFNTWLKRIDSIPDWFLRDVCRSAAGAGIGTREGDAMAEFLIHRKNDLEAILNRNRHEFTAVREWTCRGELF